MEQTHAHRLTETATTLFDRVVTTAERVGIPIATFGVGTWAIFFSVSGQVPVLAWLGAVLILASLGTYVWLTARSTIAVPSPPPPLPPEFTELLRWMRHELEREREWARSVIDDRNRPGPS